MNNMPSLYQTGNSIVKPVVTPDRKVNPKEFTPKFGHILVNRFQLLRK